MLNWEIISSNIAEAREELEKIEAEAKSKNPPDEIEFQIMLQHALHHLYFAWNIRHQSTERYSHMTDEEFQAWSKPPNDIEFNET